MYVSLRGETDPMIQTELDLTPVHAARISLAAQQGNIHHEPSPEIGRTEGRTAHGKRKADTSTEYKTVDQVSLTVSSILCLNQGPSTLQACRGRSAGAWRPES